MDKKDCIFCKMSDGRVSVEKVYESDNFFAIRDINPVSEGHTLIIPKKHYPTVLDMPVNLGTELFDSIKKVSFELIKSKKAEGFNIVQSNFHVAQQEVMHLHFHIIPRKKDDGLRYRFK